MFSGHGNSVTYDNFTPNGKTIFIGFDDATLRIWTRRKIILHQNQILPLKWKFKCTSNVHDLESSVQDEILFVESRSKSQNGSLLLKSAITTIVSPLPNVSDFWWLVFSPCHGSHYDVFGMIYRGLTDYYSKSVISQLVINSFKHF